MNIPGTPYTITKSRTGEIFHNFTNEGTYVRIDTLNPEAVSAGENLINTFMNHLGNKEEILRVFNMVKDTIINGSIDSSGNPLNPAYASSQRNTTTTNTQSTTNKDKIRELCQRMIDFFSEFQFTPNYRFMNTLWYQNNAGTAESYISNYFKMIDSPHTNSVLEKMKSTEFKGLLKVLSKLPEPSNKINKRLKLYYGPQGTGKTTKAIEETGACMVCHSAILPQDLMEDFKFNEGKPEFVPSALQNAMTDGKKITLDEINLLPFESLRFLQSILDGKTEFEYKGKTVTVKDGFEIIGTMNLVVNGCTYALPEPLVDRASDMKEFKLEAQELMGALE